MTAQEALNQTKENWAARDTELKRLLFSLDWENKVKENAAKGLTVCTVGTVSAMDFDYVTYYFGQLGFTVKVIYVIDMTSYHVGLDWITIPDWNRAYEEVKAMDKFLEGVE